MTRPSRSPTSTSASLPQPPSVFNDAVAGDLDAVTLHALAKDREARYQDATSFRDDLENVRLGRQISAAALGTAAAVGAAATQTLPQAYAAPGTPTAVQAPVTSRSERYANTAGLPAVGYDDQDPDDKKGSKGKAVLITGLVIALLALVGWGGVTWFGNQTPDVTLVAVPTIEGMKEDVAARTLATNNLRGEKSQAPSTTVTEGEVISQDPKSGSRVAEQSVVKYVVSTGPDNLTVPNVVGFNKDDARAELEKQGFVVSGFQEENTPDQDKNKVTKTEPAAQEVVAKGSKIKIFYATGNVKVPDNLVGQDWALAAVALQNAGLNPVKQTVDSDKNPDSVLSVDRAGDVVARHRHHGQGGSHPEPDGHRDGDAPAAHRHGHDDRHGDRDPAADPLRSAPGIRRRAPPEREGPFVVRGGVCRVDRRVRRRRSRGGSAPPSAARPRCRRTARGSWRACGGRPRSGRSRDGTARRAAGGRGGAPP